MPRNQGQESLVLPPGDNRAPHWTEGPQFAEPATTPDPEVFSVRHGSDTQAYSLLDREKGRLKPRPLPTIHQAEPTVQLVDVLGPTGNEIVAEIKATGQVVFHVVGDTG